MKLGIELIEISDRVRDVQESAVELIKNSMGALGQQQPIIVRKTTTGKFVLIDGQHRLAAAKRLGWAEIDADVREFPGLSDLEAELEAKRIEIETTTSCADKTLSDQLLARDAYLRLALKRRVLFDRKESETAAKNASDNVREARAAVNASQNVQQRARASNTLKRLRTIESNAVHKRTRCAQRADEVLQSLKNNVSIPANLKGISRAIEEVAKAFGMGPRQVIEEQKLTDGLGAQFLRKIRGTDLDNSMQLGAALKIKERHDIATDERMKRPNTPVGKILAAFDREYVHFWKFANSQQDKFSKGDTNTLPDWWSRLKALKAEEKSEHRKLDLAEYAATAEGQWKQVRTELPAAEKCLNAIDRVLSNEVADSRLKTKLKDVRRALKIVNELRAWAEASP